VLRALLRPLSGDIRYTEHRDAVRQSCAEAVAALAAGEGGRAALAACDAPALLKQGYGGEEHAETCAAMEEAAEKFLLHGLVPEVGAPSCHSPCATVTHCHPLCRRQACHCHSLCTQQD